MLCKSQKSGRTLTGGAWESGSKLGLEPTSALAGYVN